MEFIVKKAEMAEFATEAIIVPHFEEERQLRGGISLLDKKLNGMISEIIDSGDFEGNLNQVTVIYTRGAIAAKRIVLAGLGKRSELNREKLRGAFAGAAKQIRHLNIKRFAASPDFASDIMPIASLTETMVEGVYLGLYQFTPFKTLERNKIKEVESFMIIAENEEVFPEIKAAVKTAETICYAVCFVRDLVSTPANELTPSDLAREAEAIAMARKKVQVKILDVKEIKELGMNAFLAVSGGSCQPPKFIILEYRGGKRGQAPIALVGKGITFDSGGISLKPAEKMDEMKTDMAGGAAVMASVMAASDLNLPVNIVALIPATENLPSGRAYKPGDILKSLSGQTIEVMNTDAEGRLILVDALTYAGRYKPVAIIDIATLTGSCVVALGDNVIGMLGTATTLKERLKKAAEITDEKVWELPLWEEYHELIKSDVADFKNVGGRAAGTITAAAFLSKFVGGLPWVHLDIAGPARTAKDKPYIPKGASGVGVRLFVQFLRDWVKEDDAAD